ncbi:MAG: kynureninase [Paracoccaceae bacterium]|jgi:kynureninase
MTDFTATRAAFSLPEGITYLDGNSLGPLPKAASERVTRTITAEWGEMLIKGWNTAGWMAQPEVLGDRVGRLIGAPAGSVTLGDTLSIKVFQALAAALDMAGSRKVVLSDTGNFPSDLYMAEGLLRLMPDKRLLTVAPDAIEDALTEDIAVLMLTQVDYRTGRRHDMARITALAQAKGIVVIWDLAHSAGAFPVELEACRAEFACGCTYKYLNAGPGGPAFIYVRPDLADTVQPALAGWLGHSDPFAFDPGYRPGAGIARMRIGTPPVLQMAALESALDIWDAVDLYDVRRRSVALSERFIAGVEATCPELVLVSPREAALRGSQVSFRFTDGYALMQALISRGVIGDFRAPDLVRFGIAPLYNDETCIDHAVATLADIVATRAWDMPAFRVRAAVT